MKRHARLIGNAMSGGLEREQIERVLVLVMEATGAQTAALLLIDPETRQLVMSASAGVAQEAPPAAP
jgi:hypothetical protein